MWVVTCLVLLAVFAVSVRSDGEFVGQVRNLSVNAIPVEGIFGDELKLNVSWLQPIGEKKPSFYSVLVTSIQPNSSNFIYNNETRGSSCTAGSIYYASLDTERTQVLLPENRFVGAADDELEIEPGCIYRVQVFANPRIDRSIDASTPVTYTVPTCVGARCNCDGAINRLPMTTVHLKNFNNGSNLISWKSDWNCSLVASYKISIGVPHLTSSSGLTIYNKTDIFIGSANDNSFLWNEGELQKGTKIFVTARDSDGCPGKEGTFVVKRSRHHAIYKKNITAIVFAGLVGVCVVLSGFASFVKYFSRNYGYRLHRLQRKPSRLTSVLSNPKIEAVLKNHNSLYVDSSAQDTLLKSKNTDPYEIAYDRLHLIRELGQGQFGKVYLAHLHTDQPDNSDLVAVKMSLTSSDSARTQLEVRQQLLEEMTIIKTAEAHPHLVSLVGCCTLGTNPVCLVFEYMRGGDLLDYLHRMRDADAFNSNHEVSSLESPGITSIAETTSTSLDSQSSVRQTSGVFFPNDIKSEDLTRTFETEGAISHLEMMRFALEIAKGMQHLEAKRIVHRDLAARNVLMNENLTLKISDFGLSRKGVYMLNSPGTRRLPIRWMPPEAINRRVFTNKSDVWSYGVVIWEISTLGDFPYSDLNDDNLLHYILEENGRPEVTPIAPRELKELMQMCWATEPEARPNFEQIVMWLESKMDVTRKNNPGYLDVVIGTG